MTRWRDAHEARAFQPDLGSLAALGAYQVGAEFGTRFAGTISGDRRWISLPSGSQTTSNKELQ
jgi:hypothetical protein